MIACSHLLGNQWKIRLLTTQYLNYCLMIHLFEDSLPLFTVVCLCCRVVPFLPVAVLLTLSLSQVDRPYILAKATIPMCFLELLSVWWRVDWGISRIRFFSPLLRYSKILCVRQGCKISNQLLVGCPLFYLFSIPAHCLEGVKSKEDQIFPSRE